MNGTETENDGYFGVCPTCLNAWLCNIGNAHWMYCEQHRVKWHLGENLFSNWLHETEEQWLENYVLLKDFREIEPHSSWLNDPAHEAAQPCACERCVASALSAISACAER